MAVAETIEVELKGKGIEKLISSLNKVADACSKTAKSSAKMGRDVSNASRIVSNKISIFKKFANTISTLTRSLSRIAFYRAIRTIVKSITDALSLGLENVYFFSQTVGSTFASTMDYMAMKTYTMKNQLGAAFAALLTAVMPTLLKLISLLTQAANALTMFFSAFTGGTYLKAKDTFQTWKENAESGAAAAKEWRNQLMGFDEINKLNDQSSSGGSSGAALPNYADMFEEVEIPENVKNFVNWLKEHLDDILALVIAIGIGFAAWKIVQLISELPTLIASLPTILRNIGLIAGQILIIVGVAMSVYNIFQMWKDGVNWDNLQGAIFGIELAILGVFITLGATAGAITMLLGGLALVAVGFKDWIETGKATTETLTAITVGLALIGAAISLFTGNWIPLLVAAILIAATWIIGKWDEVKIFFATLGRYIKYTFGGAWDIMTGIVEGDTEKIRKATENIGKSWEDVKKEVTEDMDTTSKNTSKSSDDMLSSVTNATNKILSNGKSDFSAFSKSGTSAFEDLLKNINTKMPEVSTTIKSSTTDAKRTVSDNFTDMGYSVDNGLNNMVNSTESKMASFFSTIYYTFADIPYIISSAFSNAASFVYDSISSIQSWISSLDLSINSTTSKVSAISPKRYASGGNPASGSLFIAGESGAELVSSVGNHTTVSNGNQIADSVSVGNENVVSAIYSMANAIVKSIDSKDTDVSIDGMSLARKMYKYNNKVTTEHGKSLINA